MFWVFQVPILIHLHTFQVPSASLHTGVFIIVLSPTENIIPPTTSQSPPQNHSGFIIGLTVLGTVAILLVIIISMKICSEIFTTDIEDENGQLVKIKGRLTDNSINALNVYYGGAIRNNKDDIDGMIQTIDASFLHSVSTDAHPMHMNVP